MNDIIMPTKLKKIKCPICQHEKSINQFYQSNKKEYTMFNGRCYVCKKCLKDMIYVNEIPNKENMKKVLKEYLDLPYIEEAFRDAVKNPKETLGVYISSLNVGKYKGKELTWSDDTEKINNRSTEGNNDTSNFIVTPEIVIKWGQGYSNKDYEILENMYKQWTYKNKSDTLAEQKTFKFLCLKEFEIMKTRAEGKPVDKLEDTFIKFMNAANVTPKDANAATDLENSNSLGVWIKDIEKYRPAEYFKDKKKYFDFDHLMDYLNRFIFRPLKNLLTGSREFDKEFNVENVSKEKEDTD